MGKLTLRTASASVTTTAVTDQVLELSTGSGHVERLGVHAVDASGNDVTHDVVLRVRDDQGNPIVRDWTPARVFADPRAVDPLRLAVPVSGSPKWKWDAQRVAGSGTATVFLTAHQQIS